MVGVGDATWIALAGTAVAIALLALIALIVWRRPASEIRAKLGALEFTLDAVHEAINDRPKGAPTLSQQVASMADRVEQIDAKVDGVARELGAHILANPGFPNVPPGPPRPRYGR